jgi:hypothetical protein
MAADETTSTPEGNAPDVAPVPDPAAVPVPVPAVEPRLEPSAFATETTEKALSDSPVLFKRDRLEDEGLL